METLKLHGYEIKDDFTEVDMDSFLREMEEISKGDLFKPNQVNFNGMIYSKPGIFEVDLHDENLRKGLSTFEQLFEDNVIAKYVKSHVPEFGLLTSQRDITIKLQYNNGTGGAFPFHYDNPGRPNKRKITILVYLNKNWKKGDGGELVLKPFLEKDVIIEPIFGRMVIFRSDLLLHRVLPCWAPRYCFTIWVDGDSINSDDDVYLRSKHLSIDQIEFLKHSPVQRNLSRAIYTEEYKASLYECMQGTKGMSEMLKVHEMTVASLLGDSKLALFIKQLIEIKNKNEAITYSDSSV